MLVIFSGEFGFWFKGERVDTKVFLECFQKGFMRLLGDNSLKGVRGAHIGVFMGVLGRIIFWVQG